jgi:hypothetical protein
MLSTAGVAVQPAESVLAVRLQRTHAEFLSQGQGLLVVGLGLLGIGRIRVGMDGAKLVQRVRRVTACLLLPGQVEGLMCVLPGLLTASCQT